MVRSKPVFLAAVLVCLTSVASVAVRAQCPEEPPVENFTGGGSVACPCFVPQEQAGSVFTIPAGDLPAEILRVRIGWGSQFGGAPDALEQSIHIYEGGLPNPGVPIFTQNGPVLTDGVINEFDFEPLPGSILVTSSPVSVTLEFLNQNSGDPFTPTVIHDGNGCQAGKNVVFAVPGGWNDACPLGVTGDWVFGLVYRPVTCAASGAGEIPNGGDVAGVPLTVDKTTGGDLSLSWSASCNATDDDYEVYEGALGFFYSHQSRLCFTSAGTTATITPAPSSTYYLVVPRNTGAGEEGSYGRNGAGTERPQGFNACLPRFIAPCP
ncbi:MAG: hypothetical protein GY716_17470 [bacterium]|nr:hypothetical protein [bacterium]